MTEFSRGILALLLCFVFGLLLSVALCYYFMKKSALRKREKDFLKRKTHGKILLPGIEHPIKNWNQEYTIYFPEMIQVSEVLEKSPKNIINSQLNIDDNQLIIGQH